MVRIPLVDPEVLEPDHPRIAELNYPRALANNMAVLDAASDYVMALRGMLPGDVSEITILATAREKGSEFLWHHHVANARDEGISVHTIRSIGEGDGELLDPRYRAIVEFSRGQVRGEVTDTQFEALAEKFPVEDMITVSRIVGNYAGTADFIDAFEIPLDEPFVGWTPEA